MLAKQGKTAAPVLIIVVFAIFAVLVYICINKDINRIFRRKLLF